MPLAIIEIAIDAERTYSINWKKWLAGLRTIDSSVWDVALPVVLIGHTNNLVATFAKIKIPTGVVGTTYEIKNTITTNDGEKKSAKLGFLVVSG